MTDFDPAQHRMVSEQRWFEDFVLGDNRDNSADSRVSVRDGGVGLLPIDNLIGRADAVVGSWDMGVRSQPVWTWLSGLRLARFFTSVR